MTKTEIEALIEDHARWVRGRYERDNYKALLAEAAWAACRASFPVTVMKALSRGSRASSRWSCDSTSSREEISLFLRRSRTLLND